MPILKQSGKKGSRIERPTISAPLNDFRHTMHVGRGGDAFGDTSFLSNHGPAQHSEVPSSPKENGAPRPVAEDRSFQNIKVGSAGSLSQLSQSSGIESGTGSWTSSPVNCGSPKGDTSEAWSMNTSRGEVEHIDWLSASSDSGMKHAESILSFHLDLGPSIMDDVLGVMDKGVPVGGWSAIDNQYDFGFKLTNEEVDFSKGTTLSPAPCATTEPPAVQNGLTPPLIIDRVMDSPTSSTSGTLEKNPSFYEGDSEEEKRSVYEGITDDPGRDHVVGSGSGHGEDDDEEIGQGYTFDDDSDDEIGL
ncbi:cdc42 effector protein 5 [Lissotriton helveticus]